jgi:cytochrome c oxidase subunit II
VKITKQLVTGAAMVFAVAGRAQADYATNLTRGVTETSREVYDLHMFIFWVCVVIGVLVYGLMVYSIVHHRKSKGAVAAQFHENTKLEIVWTLIPFLILFAMAVPATQVMIKIYDTSASDMTVKVTGYQWKWRYTYLDDGIDFFSSLDSKSNEARQLGSNIDPTKVDHYLLNVDHPMVIPTGKKVRILLTAADVIHAWWVPDFGWKKDAIPGFVTDGWIKVDKPGTYRGQCAELCGRDHGFMPIVVIAKPESEYKQWVDEQKARKDSARSDATKTFALQELMDKGKQVYDSNCAGCHMPNGEGMPGTFPAIKGSAVALGAIDDHLAMVTKGKGIMPGFSDTLNPVEIAAVVTYQRNAFGNDKGDMIQPSEIQAQK